MTKNKKEIIIFTPTIEDGGVEKNLYNITNYLADKIDKVTVITANNNKNNFNNKINLISPNKNTWNNCNRILKSFITIKLAFNYYISKPKHLTILSFNNNIFAIILAKLIRAKIIIRSNTSIQSYLNNFFKKIIFKFFFSLADGVIVNSKEMKNEFKKILRINSTCIYNPIEKRGNIIEKSKKKIKINFFKKNHLNILNIGRLVKQKDHLTLIKSLKFIDQSIKFKLLIIGDGEEKKRILELISKENLHKNVKIIGFKKNIYPYLKSADIFVLSSLNEGLPNVLIECLSLKKIVISTNCKTGPSEILENGKFGSLVEVQNYIELGKTIEKVFNNKKNYKNKINKGYLSLKRFDYKTNCEKYYKTINKFL